MADPANPTPAPSTEPTQPTSGMSYVSETQAGFSNEHGTLLGDYHAHEQFQAHTQNHQVDTGSDVDVHGQFHNIHDYHVNGSSTSHFNLDDPGQGSHQTHQFDHQNHGFDHNNGTHQSGAFSDHGNHDSGSHGGNHDSGHVDHGGSHADHGSTGVSH